MEGGDAGSGASMPGQGSGSGAMPGLSLYMVSYGAMPVGRGDAGSGASMASGAGHRWHQGRGRRKGHRRVRGDAGSGAMPGQGRCPSEGASAGQGR